MTSTIYVEHVIVNDVSSPPKIEVNFESMQCVTNINSNLRLPNHPDFIGIIPILLENPESWPTCDWDRKILILTCVVIYLLNSHKGKQKAEYLTLISQKLKKLQEITEDFWHNLLCSEPLDLKISWGACPQTPIAKGA